MFYFDFDLKDEPATAAMSGGIIAATVAGSFFGLLLIGAACYFLCCKQSEKTVYKPNDKGSEGGEKPEVNVKTGSKSGKTGSKSKPEEHVHLMVASTLNNPQTNTVSTTPNVNTVNPKYFI